MRRFSIALLALVLAGCTHSAEFVHEAPEGEPDVASVVTGSLKIGVTSGPETDWRLERRVENEIRLSAPRSLVASAPALPDSDYTVDLHVTRKAMSSGLNFLISWPGFIIFTPAWNGLMWPYRVKTLAIVKRADGSQVALVERSDLYTAYYTSDIYGIAIGLGWFPPFYSVTSFIAGIVSSFVPEESDLHRAFILRESDEWARTVASDILRAIVNDQRGVTPPSSQ